MTILKTTEYNKVNKSIEIITSISINELFITEHQKYELMCLYYDYLIREDTIDPISENEFTVRLYNILSDDLVIFTNDDFETNVDDAYQFMDSAIECLKDICGDINNIIIYIDKVYRSYGVLFNTYRDVRLAHMVVNVFKYGVYIERKKLLSCAANKFSIDFFKCYMAEATGEDQDDIDKIIKSVSYRTKDILIGICEQHRRKTFKLTTEQI